MGAKDTQLIAWKEINLDQAKLSKQEDEVFEVILLKGGATDREIATELGWEINRVNGRRNGLVDKNLVVDRGQRRKNPISKKQNIVWESVKPIRIIEEYLLPK